MSDAEDYTVSMEDGGEDGEMDGLEGRGWA
jgi:hypothetical protein